jgi:hypothetical protein
LDNSVEIDGQMYILKQQTGKTAHVSFSSHNLELYDYVRRLAEENNKTFSGALMECIKRDMERGQPAWIDKMASKIISQISEKIDNLSLSNLHDEAQVKEEIKKGISFNIGNDLF